VFPHRWNQLQDKEMKAQDLTEDIMATPLLRGLSDRHIRVLADCACRTHFDQDQIIFRQGETANRFYLIEDGTIQLEATPKSGERRIVVGRIEPGGVLGWSWLFPPYQWQFTARALTQTRALFFYGTVLRENCETDPALGFELLKRMGEEMVKRLQSARRRLLAAEAAAGYSPIGGERAMTPERS
jgi:CRP/FNR family transcriptional regulator, cyclic AMP receptor protein